jgi:hypothetical protein
VQRPAGPAASFAPLTGGKGPNIATAVPNEDFGAVGYVQDEYSASGTATAYSGSMPADGRFQLTPTTSAPYATRILVRRPKDDSKFGGNVVVEWLNVSGGLDAAPDWTYMKDEIVRSGDIWVGVSAQLIGIDGGPIAVQAPGAAEAGAGKGIVNIDPARYGSLHHPGDAYSYDIYTQVARALREPGNVDVLHGVHPKQILAVGESQSAFALTTYADGVQPLTEAFDGFVIHSRGGSAFPLGEPGQAVGIANSLSGTPTMIRTDLRVPVIMVETETDVLSILGYYPATQPDTDHIRLWEVAGTAHADKQQIGDNEASLGCAAPVNRGQQGFVVASALNHLAGWAAGGTAPPQAPRLQVVQQNGQPAYVKDADGFAQGGIRTPAVVAPVDLLTGEAPANSSVICILFGQTQPLPAARLAELYPSRSDYEKKYADATDQLISAGFAVPGDRAALIAQSQPDRIAAG